MESILKSTLKRQLPYLIGGTITGIIITYYYGFLFSIIVNSIIWFTISTIINKFYWHYTGFRDEFYLVSKYIVHRKKNKPNNVSDMDKIAYKNDFHNTNNLQSLSKSTDNDNAGNIGSPIKS